MRAAERWQLGPVAVRNRVVFGPHATNLGRGRRIADRHAAYYRRRAAGGAGLVVTEEASVHPGDWPYERAPLAAACGPGWAVVARACHAEGATVLAALGHSGGQGTSAWSQEPLWAPSPVPGVATREVPKAMEDDDIEAVVAGFAAAATTAARAGMDGVEVNAGQHSLLRQYLSGLTNERTDAWGADRLLLTRRVLEAVRVAVGPGRAVALRLCVDELAPWAGITPDGAAAIASALAPLVDAVTVVRGGIYTVPATRPDSHIDPGFNLAAAGRLRAALPPEVAVVAQGSIVDPAMAEAALGDLRLDAVEMTRAQIADADLVGHWFAGHAERVRPCVLCNQACQVRDHRNVPVSCILDPSAGHELDGGGPPAAVGAARAAGDRAEVLVVGGGPAGLECARVAAGAGRPVRVVEARARCGGLVRAAAAGAGRARLAAAVDWLEAECRRLGVVIEAGREIDDDAVAAHPGPVVVCTGSRPGWRTYDVANGARLATAVEVLAGADVGDGPVAVWDPVGGPVAVSVAEALAAGGHHVTLITPDAIAGVGLAVTGDLEAAGARLQVAGVAVEARAVAVGVEAGWVTVEDPHTGVRRRIGAGFLVDAGPRAPDGLGLALADAGPESTAGAGPLFGSGPDVVAAGPGAVARAAAGVVVRAGDAVAPRSILEAVLEGRRAALAVVGGRS